MAELTEFERAFAMRLVQHFHLPNLPIPQALDLIRMVREALPPSPNPIAYGDKQMTTEQIEHMARRFLAWRLPEDFRPDGGITFKAEFNEHTDHPMRHEPSGTNLFDYRQAEAMVRYIVAGLPE